MELTGEYVGCDGETRRLQVSCEASGDADPLQSLSAGVAKMKELVAEFFGPLVERDAQGVTADPDDALDVFCLHTRRGHQTSLWMVVNHHVVRTSGRAASTSNP